MKNRLLPFALLLLLPLGVIEKASPVFVNAASEYTPTLISVKTDVKNINTSNDSDAEIRSYYSGLSSLSSSELKGNNLLKNLKPILQNNSKYMNYENTKYAMMITDRDWIQSPLSGTTYSYNTAPQMHVIYRSDNGTTTSPKFTGTHEKYDGTNTEKDSDYVLNKEHTWPKAMGFNKSGNYEKRPPGTDLHALMMADNNVNIQHNCFPYGDKTTVSKLGSYTTSEKSSSLRNSKGWTYSVNNMTFFEPTDEFKGDIARAQFYMVARYNNLEGDTLNTLGDGSILEANLSLTNITKSNYLGTTTTDSTSSKVVSYGDLDTLLRWHKLDPVSDYEIHRNNLIDNNYQNNRNPFIDYPDWVDVIWGDGGVSANPKTDKVSQYGNTGLIITGNKNISLNETSTYVSYIKSGYVDTKKDVIWSVDNTNIASINKITGVLSPNKTGTVTVIADTIDNDYHTEFQVTISEKKEEVTGIKIISNDPSPISLEVGDTYQLDYQITPSSLQDVTEVIWSSTPSDCISVDQNGLATALNPASGKISIKVKDKENINASIDITIKEKEVILDPEEPDEDYFINKGHADTLTITRDSFPDKTTAYGEYDNFEATSTVYCDTISGNGDIYASKDYIQANGSNNKSKGIDLTNTVAINGYITNVKVIYGGSISSGTKFWNLYLSSTRTFSYDTPSKTYSFNKDSKNISFDFDDGDKYQYFAFKSTMSVSLTSVTITYVNYERELYYFAKHFNTKIDSACNINGNTDINELKSSWATCKSGFVSLSTKSKNILNNLNSISNSEYKNEIFEMLSSYTYIINKYSTSLENFMNVSNIYNRNPNILKIQNNYQYTYIFLVSAIVATSIIIVSFLLFKRKNKNSI